MTQPGVSRPLGEPDLRHQLRLRPVRPLVRLRLHPEGRRQGLERTQPLHDPRQFLLVEAGAGVARIFERAVLVHAEQKGAEIRAHVPRLGPAADDEFLLADDLQLAPVGRPFAGLVRRVGPLGNQSFPAAIDRLLVQRLPVAARHRADAQLARRPPGQDPFQRRPPLDQRAIAEIGVAVAQQIERNVSHGRRRRSGGSRRSAGEMDASLQLLESRRLAARIERHDFAVDDDRRLERARPLAEGGDDFRELCRLFVAQP